MKVQVGLCVVCVGLAGLLLAADPPNKEAERVDVNGEGAYAKVELKGRLVVTKASDPDRAPYFRLLVRNDYYDLDLSQRKELQGDGLDKLDGRTVIVTGSLDINPQERGTGRRNPEVLVSTVRVDVAWLTPGR
jgi:uncharacterized protein (DUF736 family)